jgi:HK97 gp10 family phage protein
LARNRTTLVSNFPAVKKAAYEVVAKARDAALLDGENTANDRLERVDVTHGYDLPVDVHKENIGHQSGKIIYDHWWGRFFEYGTVYIHAAPFMRPAHRKMRKTFLDVMDDDFEGFVKRRVSVRRS